MRKKVITCLLLITLIISSIGIMPVSAQLSVSINKNSYYGGQPVRISVSGATVNGVLMFQVNDPDGSAVQSWEGTASSAGTFSSSWSTSITYDSGSYTLIVRDVGTGEVESVSFALETATSEDIATEDPEDIAPIIEDMPPGDVEDLIIILSPEVIAPIFTNMNASIIADKVGEMNSSLVASVFEKMNSSDTASIVNEMNASLAADVVEELNVSTASDVVEKMDEAAAAEVLVEVNVSSAVKILEDVVEESEEAVGEILDAAVDTGNVEEFAEILLEMDDNATAGALLSSEPESGGALVEAMAEQDLTEAAETVEAAIKLRARELDPEAGAALLQQAADMLEEVTVESLVDLFIEIVNLPDTPSTVAEVLEVMSLTKILDVVTAWIPTSDFESLSLVFDLLSVERVTSIWLGMSSAEREIVLPHLSAETVDILPELTEFIVTALSVSPTEVQVNEFVSISVTVENEGIEAGEYIIRVIINGLTEVTETVTIAAGASTTVTFSVAKDEGGTYIVEADGFSDTFTVIAPEPPIPAEFVLSNLVLSPDEVNLGEQVSVSVEIENIGEESGSYSVELSLDGVIAETESVTLDGGESTSVSFSLTAEDEGDHVVEVDGLSSSFTVTEPPVEPDYTLVYVLVAVLVLAAAGYYYWRRTRA